MNKEKNVESEKKKSFVHPTNNCLRSQPNGLWRLRSCRLKVENITFLFCYFSIVKMFMLVVFQWRLC